MGWNPFKKKEQTEEEVNRLEDDSLENSIKEALKKAQNDKREVLKEIEKIKNWQAEAVIDTYVHLFPNGELSFYREKYKETALTDYPRIKEENVKKVKPEDAEKCQKIVDNYSNQIELRKSKLKLFEKLEEEYQKTKEKLDKVNSEKERGDKFSKHSERLSSLDESAETISDAMIDTQNLEELKREFELKQEYVKQLEALNTQYSDDDINIDSSPAFKDEIDKITKEIDN